MFLSPMKKPAPLLVTGFLLSLVIAPLASALNFQPLTDTRGRTIQAHVWKVVGNEAFIQLQDGRKFRVQVSEFSPQSQAALRQVAAPRPAPSRLNPFDVASGTPPQPPAPVPPPAFSTPATPPTTEPAPFAPPPPTPSSLPPSTTAAPFASTPGEPATFAPPPPSGAVIDPTVAFLENASVLCKVDGAKINSSAIGQLMQSKAPQLEPGADAKVPFGLRQEDVQAVAFSATGLESLNFAQLQQGAGGFPPNVHFCVAATFSKSLDLQSARAEISQGYPAARFEDYGGALLAFPGDPVAKQMPAGYCAAFKNQGAGSIILLGDKLTLQSAIDGNRASQPNGLAGEDVALSVSLPPSLMEQAAGMVPPGPDGKPNPLFAAMMEPLRKMNKITLGVTFNQAMNANLGVHFSDPGVASTLAGMLQPIIGNFASQPTTPPFLKNMALVPEGDKIGLSLALQENDLEGLMKMAMAQAMGGAAPGGEIDPSAIPNSGFDQGGAPPPGGNPFGDASSSPAPAEGDNPFGGSAPAMAPAAGSNPFGDVDPASAPAAGSNPFGSASPASAPATDENPFGNAAPAAAPADGDNPFANN